MPEPTVLTFRWNERAARYVAPSGRYVSRAAVRDALDAALDHSAQTIRALTEGLRTSAVALPDWRLQMAREVKSVHLASAALAKGGWAQMAPADLGRVGQRLREQYAFLDRFAAEVESGAQRRDGTLVRRADLYIQAGRGTFHATEQREMGLRGMTEERSLRHAGDSCPGCVDEAARGWVALGDLVPVGARDCLGRCRCAVSYR
jgi:hypothetical protein